MADNILDQFGTISGFGKDSQDQDKKNILNQFGDIPGFGSKSPEAPKKEQPGMWTDIGKSALSGAITGTAALPGLPGDIAAGGRWVGEEAKRAALLAGEKLDLVKEGRAQEYSKQLEQERQSPDRDWVGYVPTSSYFIKKAEENIPGAHYDPQTVAGRFTKTAAEFLPAALTPAGGARLGTRVGSALVAATGSELAGTATAGTAAEPYARVAGALLSPIAAERYVGPLYSSLTNPEKVAYQTLVEAGQKEGAVGKAGRATQDIVDNRLAWEKQNNVAPQDSILKVADIFADSPKNLIEKYVEQSALHNPKIGEEGNRILQDFRDRQQFSNQILSDAVKSINPHAGQSIDDLQSISNSMAKQKNQTHYNAAYNDAMDVNSKYLENFMKSDTAMDAAQKAQREYNDYRVARGQVPHDFISNFMENGVGMPLELWHLTQQNLRGGPPSASIEGLNNLLKRGISDYYQNNNKPNLFESAQKTASQGFGEKNAYEEGLKLFKNANPTTARVDPVERQAFLKGFDNLATDQERAFTQAGTYQSLQTIVDTPAGRNFLNKFLEDDGNKKMLQTILDWNNPGAFETMQNGLQISNLVNKADKIDLLTKDANLRGQLSSLFSGNLTATYGIAGTAVENALLSNLMGINLVSGPVGWMLGVGGAAYGKAKSMANDKVGMEILKILDSKDPALMRQLQADIASQPQIRQGFDRVKRFMDFADKDIQKKYIQTLGRTAGGSARGTESEEKLQQYYPHKATGGQISRAIPVIKQLTQPIVPKTHYNHGGIVVQSHTK